MQSLALERWRALGEPDKYLPLAEGVMPMNVPEEISGKGRLPLANRFFPVAIAAESPCPK